MYVDDLLKSSPDAEEAIETLSNVISMCSAGGFHLTKFISNSAEVQNSFLESDRAREVKPYHLESQEMVVERALGVSCHRE